MSWQDIGAVAALLVAAASAGFSVGKISGYEKEMTRTRDRVDALEKTLMDWMAYWKRQ